MRTRRIETLLAVLTAGLVVAGAGLWIWRPSLPEVTVTPATAQPVQSPRKDRGAGRAADASVIVDENMFSSTRAAPRVRYTPPGAGDATDFASEPAPASTEIVVDAPLPQVFGTMTGPGGATALIQPDSAGASGRLYREGDQVGQYRIIRITSGSVTVRGPGGRHELRVQSKEAPRR